MGIFQKNDTIYNELDRCTYAICCSHFWWL